MYERVLRQLRERIRTRQYVMTLHAEEEMNDDLLTVFDVERVILTGVIVERQENHVSGEWKYVIDGESIDGRDVSVVGKLSVTGKLIIITVYRDE